MLTGVYYEGTEALNDDHAQVAVHNLKKFGSSTHFNLKFWLIDRFIFLSFCSSESFRKSAQAAVNAAVSTSPVFQCSIYC